MLHLKLETLPSCPQASQRHDVRRWRAIDKFSDLSIPSLKSRPHSVLVVCTLINANNARLGAADMI